MNEGRSVTAGGILRLVGSRLRYDWHRHSAGALVVAILMTTFTAFTAVSAGLDTGLAHIVATERANEYITPEYTHLTQGDLTELEQIPEVAEVVPKAIARTGIAVGLGSEVLIVGINATAEASLVREEDGSQQSTSIFRTYSGGGAQYVLTAGRWLAGPGEAVLDQSFSPDGELVGQSVQLNTSDGSRNYTVVGLLALGHPANIGTIGQPPGVESQSTGPPKTSGPHIVVGLADYPFENYTAARVVSEPRYPAMRDVADALMQRYPTEAHVYSSQIRTFERQFFDSTQAAKTLAASAALTGIVGAGAMFGVASLLLSQEERHLGLMKALGFTRGEVWLYGAGKLGALALGGVLLGGVAVFGVLPLVPMPVVGFMFDPVVSVGILYRSALRAVGFTALGSVVALFVITRKEATEALRYPG